MYSLLSMQNKKSCSGLPQRADHCSLMYLKVIFGQTDTDCGKDEETAPTPT